ncbi:MAG TPA: hypothetical protein VLJ68_10735 [Chitinophagaceae bacterium]|nr:hypothetical protein [Chitinophagaceae bacterium]
MKALKKIVVLIAVFFTSHLLFAQDGSKKVEMADGMRSNGKIYVVVAVMLTILAGLIIYIVRLDRKISRIEKDK